VEQASSCPRQPFHVEQASHYLRIVSLPFKRGRRSDRHPRRLKPQESYPEYAPLDRASQVEPIQLLLDLDRETGITPKFRSAGIDRPSEDFKRSICRTCWECIQHT